MDNKILDELIEHIKQNNIVKITFSNIRDKNLELEKVIAKLVEIKKNINIQFEYRYKRIINHENILTTDIASIKMQLEHLFSLTNTIR